MIAKYWIAQKLCVSIWQSQCAYTLIVDVTVAILNAPQTLTQIPFFHVNFQGDDRFDLMISDLMVNIKGIPQGFEAFL